MFEPWPESYLKTFDPFTDPRSTKYLAALFEHYRTEGMRVPEPPSWNILDVCCGTGLFGRSLQTHIASLGRESRLSFLDTSAAILQKVQPGPTDQTILSSVTAMKGVQSETFDVVTCRYGFNNLAQDEWLTALAEVLRVLKSGGVFLLQDHFVPGPTFSAMVNEAERFLAKMEGKHVAPFIFSTEAFNALLDEHPLVESRVKDGHSLLINIWDRLKAKKEILRDFEAAKAEIIRFYRQVCLDKYQVLIVDPQEYIHVYNVTYAIVKRS